MFNEDCPTYFPRSDRIIAIGDVHGDVERLYECLYALKVIDTNGVWIAEPKNTIVIQVGDQVDSRTRSGGPEWEKLPDYEVLYLMDRLDRQARLHGGRVISLLGNHEIMNTMGDFSYVSPNSSDSLRASRFKPGGTIAQLLSRRCAIVKIGSVLFVHGGLLPSHMSLFNNNIHVANEILRKYLRNEPLSSDEQVILMHGIIGDQGILWTRAYVTDADDGKYVDSILNYVLASTDAKMICTGHNTVQDITPLYGGRLWFLDAGFSRAYGTDRFQVLEILNDGAEFKVSNLKK